MSEAAEPPADRGVLLALLRRAGRALVRIPHPAAGALVALWMVLIWVVSSLRVVPGMGSAPAAL